MKVIPISKKCLCKIYFLHFLVPCLLFLIFGISALPVQAKTSNTASISKLDTVIEENEQEISLLISEQKQSIAECSEAINNALNTNLLVKEKDLDTLEKLSANLEIRTEKLKTIKEQQQEIQTKLDTIPKTKTGKCRKYKCRIITLQNRQLKLIYQINKDIKKIMELCSPGTD